MLFLLLFLFLHLLIPASPQQLNVFLLAGQSNMAGRGGVINNTWDGVVPPLCAPSSSVVRLTSDLSWIVAHDPLHADIDIHRTNGIGPGMPFANTLLTNNPAMGVIGLVPSAIGGSSINQWQRGTPLYNQLLSRARVALQSGGSLRALLWYQGESDTINRQDAESYKEKLSYFFFDIRSDLQAPFLPILQVGLASGEGRFVETVRRAQFGVEAPNVMTVDAKGLPLEPDHLHLTTPSQLILGRRMAEAFLERYSSVPHPLPTNSNLVFSATSSSSQISPNFYPLFLFIAKQNNFIFLLSFSLPQFTFFFLVLYEESYAVNANLLYDY